MSDEREGAGSAADAVDTDADGETRGQTAVVTRPVRPTGKRSRRGVVSDAVEPDSDEVTDAKPPKDGAGTTPKTAKDGKGPKKRVPNPFAFIWTYIQQVIAELRKVIWPNRKQMVNYTVVVLVFLAFMVTLIGLVDLGLAKLVMLVFG